MLLGIKFNTLKITILRNFSSWPFEWSLLVDSDPPRYMSVFQLPLSPATCFMYSPMRRRPRQEGSRGLASRQHDYYQLSLLVFGAGWHIWSVCTENRFSLALWRVEDIHFCWLLSRNQRSQLEELLFLTWLLTQRPPQHLCNHFLGHLGTSGSPDTMQRLWGARSFTTCMSFLPLPNTWRWFRSLPSCRAFLQTSDPIPV